MMHGQHKTYYHDGSSKTVVHCDCHKTFNPQIVPKPRMVASRGLWGIVKDWFRSKANKKCGN